ncbi:MAG TPA: hypothetical protein VGM39_17030 [Kofleriaceae bacterium]|jgi:hypothetical protein
MRTHLFALTIITLAGCAQDSDSTSIDAISTGSGSGSSSTPGTNSGSRLKARYLVADDGSKTMLGWHDAQLDMNCAFRLAEDGVQRCLPEDLPPNNVRSFANSTCTNQVFYVSADCNATSPAYVGIYTESTTLTTCIETVGVAVYKLGSEVTLGSTYGQAVGTSSCDGPYGGTTSQATWFAGTHVAPTEFVARTQEVIDP